MGKINDDKISSNEFKQLLIPEDNKNNLLSTSISSIKDSSSNSSNSFTNSSSPISTTSHLSEYSQNLHNNSLNSIKQLSPNENLDKINQTKLDTKPSINIKENKLNKDYLLIINDLENLKNYQQQKHTNSSPSTKSSSINSLNQLIKSSPSINSTNTKQINRSLTFLNDRNQQQQQQYLIDDKLNRLSKSKSTQNSNLNNNNFETNNLLQSYSAVFNDNLNDNRSNHHRFNLENRKMDNQLDNQTSKLNFKDAFYRKWFLNRFKNDSELNFDQQNSKSKKPKLINLKRYSSIDLNNEDNLNDKNRQQRQSNCDNKNEHHKQNEEPGPSGVQTSKKKYNLRSTDSKQQLTNPLHPFYLSTPYNCIDIDTWASTNNNHETSIIDDSFNDNLNNTNSNSSINDRNTQNSSSGSSSYSESNYPTLCGSNLVSSKKLTDKRNNQHEQQQNKNHKKPILLPKLHNEYCTNTNSSHHHHHHSNNKNHPNENSSSCSSTRSNSSNISTSSIDDKIDQNKTSKDKSTNDLSGSLSSVSEASTTDPDKFCKICHLNGRDEDPLISPCRCSGSMQYIHCRCLMRWLEISKKKSRKPLTCELCMYQYQWHKKFKVGKFVFPKCSRKDKFLHCAFLISVIIMICCALSIIIFFKLQEPVYRVDPRRYDLTINEPITIGLAMLFVFSFCMSLYAQVKARTTLYRLIMNFIYLNQQWYINEYEKNTKELAAGTAEIV